MWQILLQVILILLNAIFACAEIAVISMNDNKLNQMAGQGDKRAIKLSRLTSEPAKFLATIQVAITLSGFLGSAFAADNFSDSLVKVFLNMGLPFSLQTLDTIAVIIITFVLSYFTLIFGELVPKRVAMKKAESLALGMASLISFISRIFAPIVWVLTFSTNSVLRLLGIDPNADDEEFSEEEIRMMIDVGNQKGIIDIEEKEMIQNVFQFDDIKVGEFATHRRDIDVLFLNKSSEEWEKIIHSTRHSIYPVCQDEIDNVVGILKIKDYFRLEKEKREESLESIIKPAYFVPETIIADILFKRMKTTHNHFAVVLDEYGGVDGIVTMNDLLEQLVGDLENDIENGEEEVEFKKIDDNKWEIIGSYSLDKLAEDLNINLPTEEYDTFGGYVFGIYGSIPEDGSQIILDGDNIHIEVLEIKDHRIKKSEISILKKRETEDNNIEEKEE